MKKDVGPIIVFYFRPNLGLISPLTHFLFLLDKSLAYIPNGLHIFSIFAGQISGLVELVELNF